MATQGVLPFRYECEPTASGMTALAGLPPYLELAVVSGLTGSIRRHLRVCAAQKQGWSDAQIVMSLVLLNLAGGHLPFGRFGANAARWAIMVLASVRTKVGRTSR